MLLSFFAVRLVIHAAFGLRWLTAHWTIASSFLIANADKELTMVSRAQCPAGRQCVRKTVHNGVLGFHVMHRVFKHVNDGALATSRRYTFLRLKTPALRESFAIWSRPLVQWFQPQIMKRWLAFQPHFRWLFSSSFCLAFSVSNATKNCGKGNTWWSTEDHVTTFPRLHWAAQLRRSVWISVRLVRTHHWLLVRTWMLIPLTYNPNPLTNYFKPTCSIFLKCPYK